MRAGVRRGVVTVAGARLAGRRGCRDDAMGDDDEHAVRLRAMLIDPDGPQARRADDAVAYDITSVRRAAGECGYV